MKTIAVVIAAAERADEALRAAVGLTLRGDRVVVVPLVSLGAGERAQRALGTLRALGHRVDGQMADAEVADVVEVWTAGGRDALRAAIDDTPPDVFLEGLFVLRAARTLDLSGEVCPFTFVRTKLALEEMAPGARLQVVVDHEPATRNVPRSVTEWGQKVLRVDTLAPGRWAIWIEKGTR
jgi:tRNA 2-thiouridine synthesizing protein A